MNSLVSHGLVLACLWSAFLLQTSWARNTTSVTFDETCYLSLSLQSVRDGRLDPRFALSGIAPLPLLLAYGPALALGSGDDRPDPWQGRLQDARLIRGPRLWNSILAGLPLITLVYVWLCRRRHRAAAVLGAGLLTFSPTLIAHGALATTDLGAALFGLLGIAALAWYVEAPRRGRLIAASAALGAAVAAKYSGLFLLLSAALLLWRQPASRSRANGWRAWATAVRAFVARFGLLVLLTSLFCWMFHLFSFSGPLEAVPPGETAEYSPWREFLGRGFVPDALRTVAGRWAMRPSPLDGLLSQIDHNATGHPAYLLGMHSRVGWWYFFPCACFFKSTPTELLLTLAALASVLWRGRAGTAAQRTPLDAGLRSLLISAGVFALLLMTSHMNLGHRYALLLYPVVAVVGSDRVAALCAGRRGPFALAAGLLLAGQIASAAWVGPHYLAYFNGFVGGPEHGRSLLVDSSLDWGQDLPALQDFQRRHPGPLALKYFGTSLPEAWGVRALNFDDPSAELDRSHYAAVSATFLQGAYAGGADPFAAMRAIPPLARAGYSILIFDVRSQPARRAFQEAIEKRIPFLNERGELRWRSAPPPMPSGGGAPGIPPAEADALSSG